MTQLHVRELLETVYDAARGTTHAAYPTAEKTLCGVPVAATAPAPDTGDAPACGPCARTARTFRRIDHSAPASWFVPLEAAL